MRLSLLLRSIVHKAVPIKQYSSGLTPAIMREFIEKHKIDSNPENALKETKCQMRSPLEETDYSMFLHAKKLPTFPFTMMDHEFALQWIKQCKKVFEKASEMNSKNKTEKIESQMEKMGLDENQKHNFPKNVSGKYFVLDLETTIKNVRKRIANCFSRENWIVLPGWLDYTGHVMIPSTHCGANDLRFDFDFNANHPNHKTLKAPSPIHIALPNLDDYEVLVGHNLKFDLLYLWSDPNLKNFLRKGGKIWDTMYAEYFIEGQLGTVPEFYDAETNLLIEEKPRRSRKSGVFTLDALAPKYGGSRKIDVVKKAWNLGLETSQIPIEILSEYLSFDLKNTETIYLQQFKRAKSNNLFEVISKRMDFVLLSCEMEFQGLKLNEKSTEIVPTSPKRELQFMDFADENNFIRPDVALIFNLSASETYGFGKFFSYDSLKQNFFPKKVAEKPVQSRFTDGALLSFSWLNLREKCLQIFLALFDAKFEFSNDFSTQKIFQLNERLKSFQRMARYFVIQNSKVCAKKFFTRFKLEGRDADFHQVLTRVKMCAPFGSIAFEEKPSLRKVKILNSSVSTSFDLTSIENDVFGYFLTTVAHFCHGKIFRHFLGNSGDLRDNENLANTENLTNSKNLEKQKKPEKNGWKKPDLVIDREINLDTIQNGVKNVYEDKACILLCAEAGLWIDADSSVKEKVIAETRAIMESAVKDFLCHFPAIEKVVLSGKGSDAEIYAKWKNAPVAVRVENLGE